MNQKQMTQAFFNQARYLHRQWTAYEQLFRASDSRNNLLFAPKTAELFRAIQIALINDVMITISRLTDPQGRRPNKNLNSGLTDPQERGQNKNLCVERFVEHVCGIVASEKGDISQSKSAENLKRRATRLAQLVPGIRKFRNKILAHLDLDVACGDLVISPSRLQTIRRAVQAIQKIAQDGEVLEDGTYRDISSPGVASSAKWMHGCLHFGSDKSEAVSRALQAAMRHTPRRI